MKKKILMGAGIVLVLLVALGIVARQKAIGYLTPDFAVKQIEAHWNCRAHIESLDVKLLGTAMVELKGVALGPRDRFADEAVPLKDRTPMTDTEIACESVLLEVHPKGLLSKQIDIEQLVLRAPVVDTVVEQSGKASVQKLFESPAKVAPSGEGDAAISVAGTGEGAEAPAGTTAGGQAPPLPGDETFSASQLPVSARADRVRIEDGEMVATVQASGARVTLSNFQLGLNQFDVDPANLSIHNRVGFEIESDLLVQPAAGAAAEVAEYLTAHVSGSGEIHPFNPANGQVDPVWVADVTLHQGSKINTFPIVAKLRELLEGLDTAGVDLKDLNLRGELLADATTRISHERGQFTFQQPLRLELPDTTLVLREQSWLNTGSNQHAMRGTVMASEALTQKVVAKVDAYLQKKAGGFASAGLRDLVLSPVMRDGRIAIDVVSRGDFSKPQADVVTPLGNLSDVLDTGKKSLKTLEEAGKSLLKGLFGK
ncbi:MAG: hypothetical protein KDM91_08515 [Verrucomicrobiae bacterium]|nr:hypothetical protein [Verrucomicrobiae bacterium]MCP5550341.1 hypothetical protein [Akkermansiaceae bacterium]